MIEDGPLIPPALPAFNGSWIVKRISDGSIIGEFFNPENVRKFNQRTCIAIPIGVYLASLNERN